MSDISNDYLENDTPTTLLDLYLLEPNGPSLDDIVPTIQKYVSKDTTVLANSNIDINPLLSKYGRFWLDGSILYYRNTDGLDIPVKTFQIGNRISQNGLIIRVNGLPITMYAVQQLQKLLKKFATTLYHQGILNMIMYHDSTVPDIV